MKKLTKKEVISAIINDDAKLIKEYGVYNSLYLEYANGEKNWRLRKCSEYLYGVQGVKCRIIPNGFEYIKA